jgi:arsenate reductase-like glutaredoxin family protein
MSSSLQTQLSQYEVSERQAAKRLNVSGPRSGYILFSRDERQNHTGLSMGELSKIIGEKWRNLSETERTRYEELSREDRERFHTELSAALTALNGAPLPELRAKRQPKKVTVARKLGVKGALTAYIFFSMEVKDQLRRKYPDAPMTEIVRKTAQKWKRLSTAKRSKYQRLADEDKARYQRELAEGFEEHPNIRNEVLEENAALFGKKLRKRRNTYGVKNAKTAYIIYSTEVRDSVRQSNPELRMTEVSKVIARQWNALTEAQRQPFNEKALADKERFRREFEAARSRVEGTTTTVTEETEATQPTPARRRRARKTGTSSGRRRARQAEQEA